MHYLIPIDTKPHSQLGLDLAVRLFDLKDATVTVLHVLAPPDPGEMLARAKPESDEEYYKEREESVSSLLAAITRPLTKAGATVNHLIQRGLVSSTILSVGIARKVDVLILSPGHHNPRHLLLDGSVTRDILRSDFPGTLVRAHKTHHSDDRHEAVIFFSTEEESKVMKCTARNLKPSISLLLVSPAEAGHISTDDWGEHKRETITGDFTQWAHQYFKQSKVILTAVPRMQSAVRVRSAFNTPSEDDFLTLPVSTALCTEAQN